MLASTRRAATPHRRRSTTARPAAGKPEVRGPARRRELGVQPDQALYTCVCGYVFRATVSTTVGCPHCGGTQAW